MQRDGGGERGGPVGQIPGSAAFSVIIQGAAHFSESPDGHWAAWAVQPAQDSCANRTYLAPTDGTAPPRAIALPAALRHSWVTALTVTSAGRVDPLTLTATKPAVVTSAQRARSELTVCFLPSGRILTKAETTTEPGRPFWTLSLSDASRSRFSTLSASALGTVSSISCDALPAGEVFFAAAQTGEVYEAAAATLDGSPLTVGP